MSVGQAHSMPLPPLPVLRWLLLYAFSCSSARLQAILNNGYSVVQLQLMWYWEEVSTVFIYSIISTGKYRNGSFDWVFKCLTNQITNQQAQEKFEHYGVQIHFDVRDQVNPVPIILLACYAYLWKSFKVSKDNYLFHLYISAT